MRNIKIDFLRFVGLSMVVFAHVGPTGFLFQARNFDVPLMVLVAGLSYFTSYKPIGYGAYVISRFKRLVFPVWVFLTLYFLVIYLTDFPIALPSIPVILSSYFLINGIGYVWVVRVFLLVALISPFIYRYSEKQLSNSKYLLSLLIPLFVYEYVFSVVDLSNEFIEFVVGDVFFYLIPYSLIFALGVRLIKLTKTELFLVAAFFFVCFVGSAFFEYFSTGIIVATQSFKYPPRIYYLSYAGFVSVFLWIFSEGLYSIVKKARLEKFVFFIANNSIWVYLWHIPFIGLFDFNVFLNWIFVFGCAFFVAYAQVFVVAKFILPRINDAKLSRDLKSVFTG